jgi:hypothetical protein
VYTRRCDKRIERTASLGLFTPTPQLPLRTACKKKEIDEMAFFQNKEKKKGLRA